MSTSSEEGSVDGSPATSQEQVDDLRASAAAIGRELKVLGDRVKELVAAVESLTPAAPVPPAVKPVADPSPRMEVASDGVEMSITVSPLPELAMAAVAETTLRGLPGVRQVKGVKREEDWARFTLEVDPGADLVTQMKASMPVVFTVTESSPEAITLALQWAWGTS